MPTGAVWRMRYVLFTVHIDKNDEPGNPRRVYIPEEVLGTDIYAAFNDCLLTARPHAGHLFLAALAATSGVKLNLKPYINFGAAFKAAVARVHPELDVRHYIGGTPRKSMTQWMYNSGVPRHVTADIDGWSLGQRDAMGAATTGRGLLQF